MRKEALALHLCLGDGWLCENGLSRGASLWVSKDMPSEFTAALEIAQEGAAEPGKQAWLCQPGIALGCGMGKSRSRLISANALVPCHGLGVQTAPCLTATPTAGLGPPLRKAAAALGPLCRMAAS